MILLHNCDGGCDVPALEECDVEEGGVVVDELEDEHLESETVLVLRVSATVL